MLAICSVAEEIPIFTRKKILPYRTESINLFELHSNNRHKVMIFLVTFTFPCFTVKVIQQNKEIVKQALIKIQKMFL
jgi:hypothetical protein